jgi:dihydroorotase
MSASSDKQVSEKEIEIRRPDDWHVHLRDGETLNLVANYTARQFARAIIMPNLTPPVTTVDAARAYRERINRAVGPDLDFTPLMTAYLTDDIDPDEIARGYAEGVFTACKLYPANATTNSAAGVSDIARLTGVFERMQSIDMPLLIHGEVVHPEIDIFDREAVFIEKVLAPLIENFPELRIVLEHITTEDAARFVTDAGPRVAATITAHHLEINRNAMLVGGIRPHLYCLPVVKRERHRLALRKAATSGNAKFFLGTDTAPHGLEDKETACGCAGIFSAPAALEVYAQVFEEEGALDKFEAFASENGARFYRLPLNEQRIRLVRETLNVPDMIESGSVRIRPYHGGETLRWRLEEA